MHYYRCIYYIVCNIHIHTSGCHGEVPGEGHGQVVPETQQLATLWGRKEVGKRGRDKCIRDEL